MKARGFDSTMSAETEQQSKRWAAAQDVCRVIETAFAGVMLGGGVGLQEAQGLDDYADTEPVQPTEPTTRRTIGTAFPQRRCDTATAA